MGEGGVFIDNQRQFSLQHVYVVLVLQHQRGLCWGCVQALGTNLTKGLYVGDNLCWRHGSVLATSFLMLAIFFLSVKQLMRSRTKHSPSLLFQTPPHSDMSLSLNVEFDVRRSTRADKHWSPIGHEWANQETRCQDERKHCSVALRSNELGRAKSIYRYSLVST